MIGEQIKREFLCKIKNEAQNKQISSIDIKFFDEVIYIYLQLKTISSLRLFKIIQSYKCSKISSLTF